MIEVQSGGYLGEDDIELFDDHYDKSWLMLPGCNLRHRDSQNLYKAYYSG
jgi:hypothetical protein